ncbi:MFS transporter [Clostridium sp. MSJ-11]|uniref:MFS transporter n=1 Tax=Clostridium mobile TaxID=2841512 RepID=A0ABS6EEP7_9CLOT|nr:MFS transporter [Clostridium mobile]MBU5483674.1 MFS transporter [Clostridium mobile]
MNSETKNLYVMYAISYLQGLVFYGSIATIFRQSRGLSLSQIFLLESIFTISMILLEIPWGYFGDKFGYKKTLTLSYFLFFISKIVFYNSNSFLYFLAAALIGALSISGISGCDSALIYLSAGKEDSDKAFSLYASFSAAGFFTASFLSTFMIKVSLNLPVYITIFPYGMAFLLVFFLKDVKPANKELRISGSLKTVLKNKEILIFIVAIALISEATHSICIFLNGPKYLEIGVPLKYFGLLTAFMQIICIGSAKAYRIKDKFGYTLLFKGLIVLIVICSFLLAYVNKIFTTILFIAVIEGAFAIVQPLSMDIQNKSIEGEDRATILSMYAMIGNIIASFVNITIGKASDISLGFSFIFCGILSLTALILIIRWSKNWREQIDTSRRLQ